MEEAYKRTAGNVPTELWLDSHFVPIFSQIGISFSVLDHFQYIRTFFFFFLILILNLSLKSLLIMVFRSLPAFI